MVCVVPGSCTTLARKKKSIKSYITFFFSRSLNLEQEARERESEKERNKLLGIATPASSSDNSKLKNQWFYPYQMLYRQRYLNFLLTLSHTKGTICHYWIGKNN